MNVRLPLFALLLAWSCGGHSARSGVGSTSSGGDGAAPASGGVGGIGGVGGAGVVGVGAGSTRCGGDGACVAGSSSSPVAPPGPVLCGGAECAAGEACCHAPRPRFHPLNNLR